MPNVLKALGSIFNQWQQSNIPKVLSSYNNKDLEKGRVRKETEFRQQGGASDGERSCDFKQLSISSSALHL